MKQFSVAFSLLFCLGIGATPIAHAQEQASNDRVPYITSLINREVAVNSDETQPIPEPQAETPWAWYVARASGLIGFLLLYLAIFFGLAVRTPLLQRIIKPAYSASTHCWISLQALLFVLLHGMALLFDKFFHFSLVDIFVPFAFSGAPGVDTNLLALGIIAFSVQ